MLDAPASPGAIADDLGLTRTNVSNHLACLRGCGILVALPQGRSTRYELADSHIGAALSDLFEVVLAVDTGHRCLRDAGARTGVHATRGCSRQGRSGDCGHDCGALRSRESA